MIKINPSEITPEHVYLSRRKFMVGIGALAASSLAISACGEVLSPSKGGQEPSLIPPTAEPTLTSPASPPPTASTDDLGDELTSFETITNYNNYYEFTTSKKGVARLAEDFKTSPWTVEVGGAGT